MSLTKAQLQGLNTTNFPNNTTGYITPALLREFNSQSVDSMALQTQVDSLSSSFQSQLNGLEDFSSSLVTNFATVTQLNASSSTLQSNINGRATTGSVNTLSQSVYVGFSDQATINSNTINRFNADELAFNQYTQSNNAAVAGKASLSVNNSFVGDQYVTGKIEATGTVTGSNITSFALPTASFNSFTSSQNFTNSTLVTTSSFNTFSGSQYKADSASFSNRIAAVTGSVTSAITASSLITASVSQSTITFTKGDGSQFNIVVADISGGASINTGSFATTGSNSFRGTQTLLQTGSWGGVLLNVQSGSIKFNGQVADSGFSGTGSIFLSPVNLPHGSTKVVFQTEYQSGSTDPNGYDYLLGLGRQGDTTTKTVDLGTDVTLDVSRANLVGFPFTTTSSFNLFSGSQYKTDSSSFDSRIDNLEFAAGTFVNTASFNSYTQSTNDTIAGLTTTASFNSYTQSNNSTIAGLTTTASFNTFTASQIVSNSYFATTGSNTFVGSQWFSDTTDTNSYSALSEWSGSLILSAKGYSTSSFPQLTSSLANPAGVGFVNLLFKGDGVAANTILSGSNNILANPVAPTATFYRQVGNGNLALTGYLPQVSASMLFPITMNGNTLSSTANTITMRGPVSSSAWTVSANFVPGTINIGASAGSHAERIVNGLTLSTNNVPGTFNVIANQTALTGSLTTTITGNYVAGTSQLTLSSSAITYTNNIVNGTSVVDNAYYSASVGVGRITVSGNNFGGGTQNLIVSGGHVGGTAVPTFSNNVMFGNNNTLYSNVSNAAVSNSLYQHSAQNTMILGVGLIVSASSAIAQADTLGSTFVGRYNDISGNKAKTAQTVFAVGTGTSTTIKKTGFLIDSGSNTFVEGTFNVSGSTSTTGSITIQSGSGDLFVHGHKQFNVGAFQSNINQSGSAGVSQSMQFEVTDLSYGVTMASNSQITIANAGTYNIQFSTQLLADTGADNVYIWLKKNGTNVSGTAGHVTLANNDELIAAWNYVIDAAANDYYEIAWQSTAGDAILLAEAASGNIPSIPSVILTVTQVR